MLVSTSAALPADKRDIVAQDLKALRAPGKVEAALWTRRSEGYTLQVVLKVNLFGEMATGVRITPREPSATVPKVQVWLLRADGTLIQPRQTSLPGTQSVRPRTVAVEARYLFPESAGTEGVAVALQVDGEFYIQKLESFRS
ncbi:MAG: hypothetical protein M3Y79_04485 [Pseudomonadota bacterium]|nr:hypothetical protein [Pseudomonadota bacterium]